MRIIIKATNTKLSPSISQYIEEKIGGLDRFLGSYNQELVNAKVEVSKVTRDQRHGEIFRAEVNLSIEGRLIRAEETAESLLAAIDLVKDELSREIKRDKNKKTTQFIRGARSWKKFWRISPLARFRKSKVKEKL
ncbi:ribosome-associated translation inhibitor RaiA [Patescibacteria group bacterium]|nr:ribosome-associated translation inhibitor RaiA [Patescibacteria group bacterium]MBU2068110.1 ribosome-associated translation inhibitor RaiA [Patescibacteria group bacterium]